MASFADMAAAETRAYAQVLDHTWNNAHSMRQIDGTIAVRVQRLLSASSPDGGDWVEITDDGTD